MLTEKRNSTTIARGMANLTDNPILFIFFAIVSGAWFTYLLSRYFESLPYTVIVFLYGILLAVIASVSLNKHDYLVYSIIVWEHIDAELFLYIFLPILLFGEAMTLNIHQVKKALLPSVLLAGPGAAFGAYLLALVAYYILPNNWNWILCMLFGSILCATDPVSVVALLKHEASSSTSTMRLTYLIIGEALLNDATALVLFAAISQRMVGYNGHNSALLYFIFFIKVIFISPLIGFAIGIGGVLCLKVVNRRVSDEDSTIQVAISICCAYLSFFIAQYMLSVSGVISCCSCGLMFAWLGQSLILNHKTMEVIWHTLEWTGNTLIFIIAGLIVGDKSVRYVDINDFISIIEIYIFMQLSRLLLLIVCYPPIKYLQPEYSVRDCLFATFSGLRGAISLSLVILLSDHIDGSASKDALVFPSKQIHSAMFIICGVVTLTIAINGTLSGRVLNYLRITHSSASTDELIILHYVNKRIKVNSMKLFVQLRNALPKYNPELVFKMCSILQDIDENSPHLNESIELQSLPPDSKDLSPDRNNQTKSNQSDTSITSKDVLADNITISSEQKSSTNIKIPKPVSTSSLMNEITDSNVIQLKYQRSFLGIERKVDSAIDVDLIIKFRNVFLNVIRISYWNQISSGRLPRGSNAAMILLNSIDVGLETSHTPGLQDWDSLVQSMNLLNYIIEKLLYFESYPILSTIVQFLKRRYDADRIYILTSFIEAQKYAQAKIPYYLGEQEFIDTPEEDLVVKESLHNCNFAKLLLNQLDEDVISLQVSKQLSRMIIHHQEDMIMNFVGEGILSIKDAESLFSMARNDLSNLSKYIKLRKIINKNELFVGIDSNNNNINS